MPRKYTFGQKAAALIQLERNSGDMAYTASQMGVSVRALRDWNGEIQAWLLPRTPPQRQNPGIFPAFNDDLETLAFIRKQIIDEMLRLAVSFEDDSRHTTPYQRVLVLSQLIDKLMKLDQHLRPYVPVEEDIEYVLTDDVEEMDEEEFTRIHGPGVVTMEYGPHNPWYLAHPEAELLDPEDYYSEWDTPPQIPNPES